MYALRNKVQLIGNLGKTPQIKQIEGGKKMARFSVATNEVFRNAKGEKITQTQWHNVVAWGKSAELAEKHLQKGTYVMIDGKLVHSSYKSKDGSTKYATEVEVGEILLLTAKG